MIENNAGRPKRSVGKKLLIAGAVLVAAVIMGHAIWAGVERHGVNRRVAALRASGEPILPADFIPTDVNSPDNGGPDIDAAGERVGAYFDTNIGRALSNRDLGLPLRPDERVAIDAMLKELAPTVGQFDRGRAKPRQIYDVNLESPVLTNAMLVSLNGARGMAKQFTMATLIDHENGDDAAALRNIERSLFVSRYVDQHPSLVGHLVSIGCLALSTSPLFEIAPDLRIGEKKDDATPQQVRQLINAFLDDGPPTEGLRRAFRGERMGQLDTMQSLARGVPIKLERDKDAEPWNPMLRYFTMPMIQHNAASMIDHMNAVMPALDAADRPSALAKLPAKPQGSNPFNALSQILLPALERAVETHYRVTSDRRLAATTLAIRWYQLEHDGKRPAKLDDLVPKYLPAVPKDALLADKPIGYLPDADRPRLYSAGQNNLDDGGRDAFIRPYPDGRASGRGDEWNTLDRCVYLDRLPRPAPATEPAEPE